jgi:hypothetical protein
MELGEGIVGNLLLATLALCARCCSAYLFLSLHVDDQSQTDPMKSSSEDAQDARWRRDPKGLGGSRFRARLNFPHLTEAPPSLILHVTRSVPSMIGPCY